MSNSSASSAALLVGDQAFAAVALELRQRHRARIAKHTKTIDAWRDDFEAFAAELDVLDKEGLRVRVRPTAMLLMFEAQRSGRDVVLKPRQVWFTTWECARDLYCFFTWDSAHVVIIAPSDSGDNAIREIETRINVMLGLDDEAWKRGHGLIGRHPWLAPLVRWEYGELKFGSARLEIKGAGASKNAARKVGRAGTVQRLHITEISSFEFAEDTWTAIQPTVPTGERSEITIESTAQGAGGLFYSLYNDAKLNKSSFKTFFFAWVKHQEYRARLEPGEEIRAVTPREKELVRKHGASANQVKWYRAKVADLGSQDKADQEYPLDEETCWLVAGRSFFEPERTKVLLTETTEPKRVEKLKSSVPDPSSLNELRVWEEPFQRDVYIVVADPSEGVVGGDQCAAAVFHRATGRHVATVTGRWRTHEFAAVLERVGHRYNTATIIVERINHGHAVLNALLRLEIESEEDEESEREQRRSRAYPRVYHDPGDEKAGWKTGEVPRATALEALESAHRTKRWACPCRLTVAEVQKFIIDKKGKPTASAGAYDDLVLVQAIGWSILSRPMGRPPRTGGGQLRYASDEGGRGFY